MELRKLLKLTDVWAHYGRVAAIQGLDLRVEEGEFVGLVGNNGAGKSTTMRVISGTLKPSAGQIEFEGKRIAGRSPERIVRYGISLVPENRRIFSRLSVLENLQIGTSGRRDRNQARGEIDEMLERFPALERYRDSPGADLSGGEQQQLAIARALLAKPRLLLLDEPTLGLAPLIVDQVFDLLAQLKSEGVTILLVEQNAVRTVSVADRVYVMRSGGQIVFEGTAESMESEGHLQSSFLSI
jgi:branched-chain amino acid transport system ATP-binding protein